MRHVVWVVRHIHELVVDVAVRERAPSHAAAFFHDAVTTRRANDNEAESAALAERVLAELGWTPSRCRLVGDLVRATAGHDPTATPIGSVLIDADLAVLGSEPAAYQAYATGVRVEYAHLDDDVAARPGRGAAPLLARQPLYATEPGQRRWESPGARRPRR